VSHDLRVDDRVRHPKWNATGTVIEVGRSDVRVDWDRKFPIPLTMRVPAAELRKLDVVERIGEMDRG
jgi:hypothetical protein